MLYCFDIEAYKYFDYMKGELKLSKKMKNGILYKQNVGITNFDGEKIDITGKVVMPLSGIKQISILNNIIEKNGGILSTNNDEINIILNWPKSIKTERNVKIMTGKEISDNINQIEEEYGNEIFFKTVEKNFSNVIATDVIKNKNTVFSKTLEKYSDNNFILSKKVNVSYDDLGEQEYRCFIINNEIYNISRRTTSILHKIDSDVFSVANSIVDRLKDKFPKNYVLDLFKYTDDNGKKHIDVVEFNPVEASGLYLYNSRIKKSNDILHNNTRNIAYEFYDNLDYCKSHGKMLEGSSNNYPQRETFAADLLSYRVLGDFGAFIHDLILDDDDFGFVWDNDNKEKKL